MFIHPQTSSHTILILSVIAAVGLMLGSIRYHGVSLGIAAVMFVGLIAAPLIGVEQLNLEMVAGIRDFGLIVFVYAVGLQVGPGFLSSLRREGLSLNVMAVAIVLLGGLLAWVLPLFAPLDVHSIPGLFAGAVTNAPALASAQETQRSFASGATNASANAQMMASAFAISYPFGMIGVIVAISLLRRAFKVDLVKEAAALEARMGTAQILPHAASIVVKNQNIAGLYLREIPSLRNAQVVVSRIYQNNELKAAHPDTKVNLGDIILAVGQEEALRDLVITVGERSELDLRQIRSSISSRAILVTHQNVVGRSLAELNLRRRFGVTITRLNRSSVELAASGALRLQFGDKVLAVGEPSALDLAAAELGDSVRELNLPRLLSVFVGLALGILLGNIPFTLPSLPIPFKLGLAAGPMIVALTLAGLGRVGRIIWYMPPNASAMLRELGIVLYLSAVGLQSGDQFFTALENGSGVLWLAYGALVTLVPLIIVGALAYRVWKVNFLHVCGLLTGSMTSPVLAYTHTLTPSDAPSIVFATVYPLTMMTRVVVAQLLAFFFS